jgi:hypothetical protein
VLLQALAIPSASRRLRIRNVLLAATSLETLSSKLVAHGQDNQGPEIRIGCRHYILKLLRPKQAIATGEIDKGQTLSQDIQLK